MPSLFLATARNKVDDESEWPRQDGHLRGDLLLVLASLMAASRSSAHAELCCFEPGETCTQGRAAESGGCAA